MKEPAVYIMASKRKGTLYTGVTSDLAQRIYQHKMGLSKGFSSKYDCKTLVFYELHESMISAIEREKQIKGGPRKMKVQLIENLNPKWQGLYNDVI